MKYKFWILLLIWGYVISGFATAATRYGENHPDVDTAALYHFEGNANDETSNNNDGTLYGPTASYGLLGQAYDFDGNNDYITVPDDNSLDISGNITIEFWIKLTQGSETYPDVLTKGGYEEAYSIWVDWDVSQYVFAIDNDLGTLNSTSAPTGSWGYWAFIKDGTTARIFYNGEQDNSGSAPSSISTNTGVLSISTSTYPLDAVLDELRISNRALTATEVRKNYQMMKGQFGIFESLLVK